MDLGDAIQELETLILCGIGRPLTGHSLVTT